MFLLCFLSFFIFHLFPVDLCPTISAVSCHLDLGVTQFFSLFGSTSFNSSRSPFPSHPQICFLSLITDSTQFSKALLFLYLSSYIEQAFTSDSGCFLYHVWVVPISPLSVSFFSIQYPPLHYGQDASFFQRRSNSNTRELTKNELDFPTTWTQSSGALAGSRSPGCPQAQRNVSPQGLGLHWGSCSDKRVRSMLNEVTFILLPKFKDAVVSTSKWLGFWPAFNVVISQGFAIA